jgi:AcrR family transcriptional regulator
VATTKLRAARAVTTRETILTVAERLFAERGVFAVSNRQISEVAGLGNNTAVSYHFGTKTDLIRAIMAEHASRMDERRRVLLAEYESSTELRDWVVVTVRPVTDHLAALGTPSWYGRFAAQLMTDPALRDIMTAEALYSPTMRAAAEGLIHRQPGLPAEVRAERHGMIRALMVHTCAERERTLADVGRNCADVDAAAAWRSTEAYLVDAIAGLLSAPVSAP